MKRKRPKIGDVIEIPTPKGLAYAQYTHNNRLYGYLIRVLPGFYEKRPTDFSELVRQKECYFVFFILGVAASQGLVKIVANEPIPSQSRKFPLFRTGAHDTEGRVPNWWLWDGKREWFIGELKPEHYQLPIAEIWTDVFLVDRITQGWKPEDDLGIPSVEVSPMDEKPIAATSPDGAALEQLRLAGSDMDNPHRFVHYLYFPRKQNAVRAGQALEAEHFVVEVAPAAEGTNWLVLATHSVEPVVETIEPVRLRLEKLAASFGGEYDGWEAEVVR
jgi:hypothetical protein